MAVDLERQPDSPEEVDSYNPLAERINYLHGLTRRFQVRPNGTVIRRPDKTVHDDRYTWFSTDPMVRYLGSIDRIVTPFNRRKFRDPIIEALDAYGGKDDHFAHLSPSANRINPGRKPDHLCGIVSFGDDVGTILAHRLAEESLRKLYQLYQ